MGGIPAASALSFARRTISNSARVSVSFMRTPICPSRIVSRSSLARPMHSTFSNECVQCQSMARGRVSARGQSRTIRPKAVTRRGSWSTDRGRSSGSSAQARERRVGSHFRAPLLRSIRAHAGVTHPPPRLVALDLRSIRACAGVMPAMPVAVASQAGPSAQARERRCGFASHKSSLAVHPRMRGGDTSKFHNFFPQTGAMCPGPVSPRVGREDRPVASYGVGRRWVDVNERRVTI